jgi:hypothetical protein
MSIHKANFNKRLKLQTVHGPVKSTTIYRHEHNTKDPLSWTWSVVVHSGFDVTTYQYGLFSEAQVQFKKLIKGGVIC